MKAYYEELWERLPDELSPPDFELRRRFMLTGTRPGERALDLGCGDGTFTAELQRAGARAVGAEVAPAAVRRAREHHRSLEFMLVPIEPPLPFADASFDLVWASEVIEHVADTARWLSELRRVLVPAGQVLLTTPNHGRLRVALGGIERYSEPLGDHLHLYTARSLRELLQEFAFGDVEVQTAAGPPLLRRLLLASAVR